MLVCHIWFAKNLLKKQKQLFCKYFEIKRVFYILISWKSHILNVAVFLIFAREESSSMSISSDFLPFWHLGEASSLSRFNLARRFWNQVITL